MVKRYWKAVLLMALLPLASATFAAEKAIIGPVARLNVVEADLSYLARIDTGASKTSIHAENMEVVGGEVEDWDDNIGKTIRFDTANESGTQATIEAEIADVLHIRNSQGSEDRYVVWLHVGEQDKERRVLVTLKERGPMTYKLLIGRNWLQGQYLVDVELPDEK
ncbi:ATP-dependent zinc protease [Ferrimonas balearica]|uniref:ATP-dependent zinc protease family protein n=1 Tax=Ferrimonas balearica TaxID=44012 RepID=UPI001C98EB23|nr:RimK/LysX family protein [Ferrimonas balearica]MBY5920686.1 RimK/LysX family protein [Ferrimonas balearica]MBY5996629.1 RimK/LysX family protein [Ferrimonas balearica]